MHRIIFRHDSSLQIRPQGFFYCRALLVLYSSENSGPKTASNAGVTSCQKYTQSTFSVMLVLLLCPALHLPDESSYLEGKSWT
jgi:hypothetical protein